MVDQLKGRKTWVTRYAAIHLALNSGLRVSEIAALKIRDLSLDGRNNYLIVQRGKGKRKRDVHLDKEIVKHLKAYIDMKKSWGEPVTEDAPVFAGRSGNHFSGNSPAYQF